MGWRIGWLTKLIGMKLRLLICTVCLCFCAFSESIMEIYVAKDTVIESQNGSVVIVGSIDGYGGDCSDPYVYLDDSLRIPVSEGKFSIESKSGGKHKIAVGGSNCDEVIYKNVDFTTNRYMEITFTLYRNDIPVLVEKPVVYLYSNETIDFKVQLEPIGELLFTYPYYENKWQGIVQNQKLIVNDKEYEYLFWESEQSGLASSVDWQDADVVSSKDMIPYLENQLSGIGLNSRERNDFITYWAPRMLRYSNVEVVFLINESCVEAIGNLNVSPTPDNMLRVFMVFRSSKPAAKSDKVSIPVNTFNRDGFSVVEWGGAEIKPHL